jgi:hypothetical protein
MENQERWMKWLETETIKDKREVENHKHKIISEITGLKKEDILPKKEKLTLWQRLKKMFLM